MSGNRRQIRLEEERKRLETINSDSAYVRVQPIDAVPGRAPERYKVRFHCRGIARIDASRRPIYATEHEVQIYCHQDFPADVPWLQWETPIWHPNIEHSGQKRVCVNKAEWLGGMSLADLCHQMFEMVQYKNYHAALTDPYPLDLEAAAWVRDYAEPEGIVDKNRGIFVDNLPFYKPEAAERVSRIHIVNRDVPNTTGFRIKLQPRAEPDPSAGRVVLQAGATLPPIQCHECGAALSLDSQFCDRCGVKVVAKVRRVRIGA
jgi:ubiquitin-protein ligase